MTQRSYDFWFDRMTSGVDEGFAAIKQYLTSFNEHLNRLGTDWWKRVEDFDKGQNDDEWGGYADSLGEESQQLELFGKLLANTTMLSIVTYFELQAVTLTRTYFRFLNRKNFADHEQLEAAARAAVRRYENLGKYWTEHKLPFNRGARWDEIQKIGKVRNKIAHTNGELSDDGDSTAIRQFVAKRHTDGDTSLKVEGDFIVVEPEYCIEVMGVFKELLLDIIDETAKVRN